jgi:putative ABC transport system permease protein
MHAKSDRIFRVVEKRIAADKEFKIPMTAGILAPTLKNEHAGVKNYVRLISRYTTGRFTVQHNERKFYEGNHYLAEKTLFDVFDFQFLKGNKEEALKEPRSIVLGDFKVTAVLKNLPKNSHLDFEMLLPLSILQGAKAWDEWINSWKSDGIISYLLLDNESDEQRVQDAINQLTSENFSSEEGVKRSAYLQPLTDIHFFSDDIEFDENANKGDISYLYILGAVALFILIIASFNFMNLATARSEKRLKEIGMRKVLGAHRKNLIKQFLGESLINVFISLVISLALIELLIPYFNVFTNKEISLNYFSNIYLLPGLLVLAILIGLFAGSYPAIYLSKFQPVQILKGSLKSNSGGSGIRKTLVITQFAISVGMIIATLVVYNQLEYVRETKLGFEEENTIVVDINNSGTRSNYLTIKNEMKNYTSVKSVTVSSRVPGDWKNIAEIEVKPEGVESPDPVTVTFISIDHDFIPAYKIDLLGGRNFYETGDSTSFIINEAALRFFKWDNPVGKRISIKDENFEGRVVGVVKDFHFKSLYEKITPLVLGYWNNPVDAIDYFSVKTTNTDLSGTLSHLKQIHEHFDKVTPFEYNFLDERLNDFYQNDQRMGSLFGIVALLAVFIACLGLFALASYITLQRSKEIGIRKILGASVPSILMLLSGEFLKLVLIAFLIASPIAYYLMSEWLKDFAYSTNIGIWIFIVAGFASIIITFITVSYQSIKASLINPAKSLKYE